MSTSNASGNLETRRHADAFGNVIPNYHNGLWGSDSESAGWAHNTKKLDGNTGLVYMYQRWYLPETGTFLSSAPYPPMEEHRYAFVEGIPTVGTDSDGRQWDPRLQPGEMEEFYNFDYEECRCVPYPTQCVCNYNKCRETADQLLRIGTLACAYACRNAGILAASCMMACNIGNFNAFAVYNSHCAMALIGCEVGYSK